MKGQTMAYNGDSACVGSGARMKGDPAPDIGQLENIDNSIRSLINEARDISALLDGVADRVFGSQPQEVVGRGDSVEDSPYAMGRIDEGMTSLRAAMFELRMQAWRFTAL